MDSLRIFDVIYATTLGGPMSACRQGIPEAPLEGGVDADGNDPRRVRQFIFRGWPKRIRD